MPTDKEHADILLQLCEDLFIRACVLQALLDEAALADWPRRLDKTVNSEQAIPLREEFRALYQPLLESLFPAMNLDGFGWVIAGGESGSGAEYHWDRTGNWRKEFSTDGRRYMAVKWAEELRDACVARNIPFLFKQATAPQSGMGTNLLGRIWHEFPPAPNGLQWEMEKHEWNLVQIRDYKERAA